jgi:hypothetical protein
VDDTDLTHVARSSVGMERRMRRRGISMCGSRTLTWCLIVNFIIIPPLYNCTMPFINHRRLYRVRTEVTCYEYIHMLLQRLISSRRTRVIRRDHGYFLAALLKR